MPNINIHLVNITSFNGGLLEDKREGWKYSGGSWTTQYYSVAKHFDPFTYPKKLVPHYQTVAAGADSATTQHGYNILQTIYAPYEGGYRLYGLGVKSGGYVKLYVQNIDAGSLDSATWLAADNGECSAGSQNAGMFFYYSGYLYFMRSSTDISRYKTSSTTGMSEGWQTVSQTTAPVQPVHHSSDDLAYFASDTHIYSYDGSSWTDALTLPSDYTTVALAEFGNYLAIGRVKNGSEDIDSVVYLWDRDSSLTTITQRIDFGKGTLRYLANLQGRLIGVMDFYGNNSFSLNKGRVMIKRANGVIADTLNTLTLDTTYSPYLATTNFYVQDDKLYFVNAAPLNGDSRFGIWVTDFNGRLALDTLEANASQVSYYNFIYKTGEMFWIGYYDGTGNVVSRSDAEEGYSSSLASVYESLIFNGGDSSQKNHLLGITVTTEPMPSAGQIVLKYRKNLENPDGTATTETSWTTIFTNTTDNSVSHNAVNIEADGSQLPDFNEIQFRVESTGGAVLTGLRFAYESKPDSPYQP